MVGVVQSLVVKCNAKTKRNDLWHQKLGHVYIQTLTTMEINNLVESMDFNGNHDLNGGCVYGTPSYIISFEWGFFVQKKFLSLCK